MGGVGQGHGGAEKEGRRGRGDEARQHGICCSKDWRNDGELVVGGGHLGLGQTQMHCWVDCF